MTDFVWPSDIDRAESEELARVCDRLEEVEGERDALAAHVEQLQAWIEFRQVASAGPAASLARRDAQQQKKGLTLAFDDPIWGHLSGDAKGLISEKLDQLEDQSEMDENDGY